ncbi:hypothetical protein [Cellulomonas sp. GbtcB1]|uniref:hypothetical protein n=1 Tax=Cellulomonas sp. GbtcB1 TaxID=2824746 RepID=UPI001C30B1F3|nr:hypothetical protein [Cellulomonas sp. GbtcB1]
MTIRPDDPATTEDEPPPGPTLGDRLARLRWTPGRVAWLGASVVVLGALFDLALLRIYTSSGVRVAQWLATLLSHLSTTLTVLGPALLAVALGAALLRHRTPADPG